MESAPKMALFFSHGVSLDTWQRLGLLDREVGYYKQLSAALGTIVFVTYDTPKTLSDTLVRKIEPISALINRWSLPFPAFGIMAPILHWRRLKKCRLLKTNQLSGAWTATLAARLLRKPLIVRCGFVKSLFDVHAGRKGLRQRMSRWVEGLSLRAADMIFVATEADRSYLSETHRIPIDRFRIIRNPIETERFRPMPEITRVPGRVVFVGRLNKQKNLHVLIDACRQVEGVHLIVAGSGELEVKLRQRAQGAAVEFRGPVPNDQLPALLNSAEVFALSSLYEGLPKALLEAMACGSAVVGADSPGIREVISHNHNGLLCAGEAGAFVAAIRSLTRDAALRARLGKAAVETIATTFSRDAVLGDELACIASLVQE